MLNLVGGPPFLTSLSNITPESIISLEKLFSPEVIEQINRFRNKEIDYLIIRGMPVSDDLPDTPTKIRSNSQPQAEKAILVSLASTFGNISEKGVENTIRFNLEGEKTNTETWHSHFQHLTSVFYCLRGDQEAKTYFLSANELMSDAGGANGLLTKHQNYIEGLPEFSLIEGAPTKYTFSKHIFDRSEVEKYIDDLDLPDVTKMLKKIVEKASDQEAKQAVTYIISRLENASDFISYLPGDIMMVHEPSVIRYSKGYKPSSPADKARWLLAVSVS